MRQVISSFVGVVCMSLFTLAHANSKSPAAPVQSGVSEPSANSATSSASSDLSITSGAPVMPILGGPLTPAQVDLLFSRSIDEFVYKLRDPFKMPELEVKAAELKTDLERYSVNDFKVVGLLTGPKRVKAMLLTPDGKTYFVSEKMKIGPSGGIIYRITSDGIQIREKVVNAIGQKENLDTVIKMAASSNNSDSMPRRSLGNSSTSQNQGSATGGAGGQ